jgi:hypothetical protein
LEDLLHCLNRSHPHLFSGNLAYQGIIVENNQGVALLYEITRLTQIEMMTEKEKN